MMRFTNPLNRRKTAGSPRLIGPIVGLSLATIATAVYLSPASSSVQSTRADAATAPSTSASGSPSASPSGTATDEKVVDDPTKSKSGTPTPSGSVKTTTKTKTDIIRSTKVDVVHSTKTVTAATPQEHCTSFSWQQDAQAAYAANLSDPWGLDGAVGPHNGDGLACTQLPVDPARARSVATDAYIAPAPASKSSLTNPNQDYYGVAEDGLPGDTGILDGIDQAADKAPSAIEYFSNWSANFDPAPVNQSWSRGALPIMTWMSVAADSTSANASSYTLANIVSGQFDSYLLRYAGAILQNGQPLGIRFDHEMNGNWYPWSAGFTANTGASGAPNLYVQAWRHVWNVFQSVGANADVIWLWSPVRVDTLTPHSTQSGLKYETNLAEDYPGDQYVDWMGMTAYEYKTTESWTFTGTFSQTLTGLHGISSKPIFISETGASQVVGTTDMTALKAQWTVQALAGFVNDRSIVGFVWFNNTVSDVHKNDGVPFQTDWQFTTSPQAQAAFKAGVADSRYASGLMPDGIGAS